MRDGDGGYLVDGVEECAGAMVRLLDDPAEAAELGLRGQERVREHFLHPRLLLNELSLMSDLLEGRPARAERGEIVRDPVCGMVLGPPDAVREEFRGRTFFFCSVGCRARFGAEPERYAGAA
jgi:trehalose synthase